jgi:amino acid permease
VELTAAAVILDYWTGALQAWQWAIIIVVPIFALQLIHVRVYGKVIHDGFVGHALIFGTTGEMEYWFAMIKVVLVVLFIIIGLIYDWGGVIGHPGPVSLILRDYVVPC